MLEPRSPSAQRSDSPGIPSKAARIVIAEDDVEMRALLCEIVAERYCVISAANGAEALALARADPPDLILTDIGMPQLDGLGLLEIVRADPQLRDIPVVLVTAQDERVAPDWMRQGADDYLTKPFSRSELLARLAARLEIASLRREAEAARTHASQILDSVTDALCAVDRHWRFTFVNQEAERLFGRDRSSLLGADLWREFLTGMDAPLSEALYRAMTERVRVSLEYFHAPLGAWFDTSAFPAPEGGLSVYFRDITRAVRGRQALEESEQRYRALVEISPQIVWFGEAQGSQMYWNQRWMDLTGLDLASSQGTGWQRAIHPDHRQAVIAHWNAARARGENFEAEFPLCNVQGGYRWHLSRGIPVRDASGQIVRWIGAMLDIHDRKVAEEERERLLAQLEVERRRLRAVIEHVPAGISLAEAPEGRVVLSNPQADRILGSSALKITTIDAYDRWVGYHPDGSRVAAEEWPLAIALRGKTVMSADYVYEHPNGTRAWLRVSASPICAENGSIVGAIVIFYEVDREKREQAEREKLLEALRESDRRKDEFLAMLAHELRNPLSAVKNAVAVLEMSGSAEDRTWAAKVVQRQVGQLTHLVDDLLDVSRISSGKICLRKELLNVEDVIARSAECVFPLMANREHRFEVSCEETVPLLVEGDATRLEQVVINLLTNAAKYTGHGGLIRLTAFREGEEIVIKVSDNGIGIPPSNLPQMFELFTQGERSIARSEGGLGLGLTIVRKLAELHHGTVEAHSEGLGHGSEFRVRLPAARVLHQEPLPPEERPDAHSPNRLMRILVVDDNQDTAHGLSRLLKLLGHHVEVAYDGLRAVEAAEAMHPEVILLDIGLPGLDGHEAALQIRQRPWSHNTMLIAVSGYGQEEDRRKSRAAGFAHHLIKPLDYDELKALLERCR